MGEPQPREMSRDARASELADLERRELEISARRRKLHDRLDSFANELTQRCARDLSDERRAIHHRIDQLLASMGEEYRQGRR